VVKYEINISLKLKSHFKYKLSCKNTSTWVNPGDNCSKLTCQGVIKPKSVQGILGLLIGGLIKLPRK